MQYIGRKIYYDKFTGNILVDTGEMFGDIRETTTEEDFATYRTLAERVPETVGCIRIPYGQDADKFAQYRYRVDPTTETIVWDTTPIGASLEEAKAAKIAFLDNECSQAIYRGFFSVSTGYHFGFDQEDQDNFNQMTTLLLLKSDITEIQWKTDDAGVVTLTREQFLKVVEEAAQHKQAQIARYWTLKAQVLAAETKEEVDAVNW